MHCSDDESKLDEYNTIIAHATLHGYDKLFVDNINRSLLYTNRTHTQQRTVKSFIQPVPYHAAMKPISNILKKHDKFLPFTRLNTTFHTLKNIKPPLPPTQRAGVYIIPIYNNDINRNEIYIGSTTRSLAIRLSEHKRDISNANFSTALAKHFFEFNINIQWDQARVIRKYNKTEDIKTLEAIIIAKFKKKAHVINDNQPMKILCFWDMPRRNTL